MTNNQMFGLKQALEAAGDLRGVKFSYAVAKNLSKINKEVELIQEAIKPSTEYAAYDTKRIELAKEHAKKDENDKPLMTKRGKEFDIEDLPKFEKALEKLKKEHQPAVDARIKQLEEFDKLLLEESKVEIHKVKLEDVPEDITSKQMTSLFEMIDDNENSWTL